MSTQRTVGKQKIHNIIIHNSQQEERIQMLINWCINNIPYKMDYNSVTCYNMDGLQNITLSERNHMRKTTYFLYMRCSEKANL